VDPFSGLAYGLSVAFTPENLLIAFLGVLIGTLIGVIPGLGPVAGAALVLPLAFTLDPVASIIMIAGIYYGAQYGGSTTAVLLNVPGETSSVITAIDGHQLARQGRAGATLSIMAIGSFVAGTISVVLVMFFTPVLSDVGLAFGPAEFFALTLGGLLAFSRISGGGLTSNLLPLFLGLALGTVGLEGVTSHFRFTFGEIDLAQGIALVPVAVGIYGISEMLMLASGLRTGTPPKVRLRELLPSREDLRRATPSWGRGTLLGFLFGLLPGPSASLSSFASYRVEKAFSRHRDQIGKGAIEGVAGPEAANNAAATSSMIPVLGLGIPFSATLALALSALIVQGIEPGPLLIESHPEIFWGVIASMYIGNVMLVALNLPLVGIWVRLLRCPPAFLVPSVILIALVGAFSVSGSYLDVLILLTMGAVGYAFRVAGFQLTPVILGVVLGPLVEKHLREGLFLSGGDVTYFLSTPIAIGIWSLVALLLLGPVVKGRLRSRADRTEATPPEKELVS
jgi:putative tricarboxylic transport membrane protein